MPIHEIARFITLVLSDIFAFAGIVQLAGPRAVRDVYRNWNFSQGLRRIAAMLDLLAAGLLVLPATHVFGIALAGLISFGAVVFLLGCERYVYALPGILVLIALAPAMPAFSH